MKAQSISKFDYSELRRINAKKKRVHELRCHIAIFLLSLILFTVLFTLLYSNKSQAAGNSDDKMYKYYTSIEIQCGDTLTSICKSNISSDYTLDTLMNEVIYINNINDSSSLIAGDYLIIPYYDTFKG